MARAYFDQNPFGAAPIEPGLDVIRRTYSQKAPTPMASLSKAIQEPFVTDVIVPGISRIRSELQAAEREDAIRQMAAQRAADEASMPLTGLAPAGSPLKTPAPTHVPLVGISELARFSGPSAGLLPQEVAGLVPTATDPRDIVSAATFLEGLYARKRAGEMVDKQIDAGEQQLFLQGMADVANAIRGGATARDAIRAAQEALQPTRERIVDAQEARDMGLDALISGEDEVSDQVVATPAGVEVSEQEEAIISTPAPTDKAFGAASTPQAMAAVAARAAGGRRLPAGFMPRTEAEFRWAMMSTDDPAEKMMLLRLSRGATDVHPSGPGAIRNAITGAAGRSTQALLLADEVARKKAAEAKRLAELKLADQAKRLAIQAKRAEAYRKAQSALERKRNADAKKLEDSLKKIAKASSRKGIRRDEAAILRNLSAFLAGKESFDTGYQGLETQTIEGIQAWPELRKLGNKSAALARSAISNAIRLKNGRDMGDRLMFMNIGQLEGFAREDARAADAAQRAAQKAAEAEAKARGRRAREAAIAAREKAEREAEEAAKKAEESRKDAQDAVNASAGSAESAPPAAGEAPPADGTSQVGRFKIKVKGKKEE